MALLTKPGRFDIVKQSLLPVTISAVMLVLIFPGFSYSYLAWIALVPLFLLIFRSGDVTATCSSCATGILFYLGMLHWVIRVEDANPYNFAVIILFFATFFLLFAIPAKYFHERFPGWDALTFPAIWVSVEYLKTHIGFLSFPQGILGYSQYKVLPVAAIAQFTGVYGVSFVIIAVNAALASIVRDWLVNGFRLKFGAVGISRLNVVAILLVGALIAALAVLDGKAEVAKKIVDLALVQGNDVANKKSGGNDKYAREILPVYQQLTEQAAASGASLVIWPSSSVPGRFPSDLHTVQYVRDIAVKSSVYLLIGAAGIDKLNHKKGAEQQPSTAAFLFAPQGNMVGRYDKIHLLPFDEYVPMRSYLSWPSWIVAPDKKDNIPGKKLSLMQAGSYRFGVQICFENMFPEQIRRLVSDGAEFLVAQTNDVWTKSDDGQYQNLAFNVFRAIENRIPVIRSSTNGVSCVIDAQGRIIASVKDSSGKEVNISGLSLSRISVSKGRNTFYNRFGDLFVISVLSLTVIMGIFGYAKKQVSVT